MALVAAALVVVAACGAAPPMLSDDQLCELWVAHELREITGAWERRLVLDVACESARPAGGFILVTVASAAGQAPISAATVRDLRDRIVVAVEAAVERRGWGGRYPSRTVEYAP